MAARSKFPILALAAGLALAGCVSEGPFPSLAPRPGENELATSEPDRTAPEPAIDTALRERIRALGTQAAEGARSFDADFAAADAAIRNAGAEGSDSWIEAQQALSRLEAARSRTTQARADLDRLAIDRTGMPTASTDLEAIQQAIEEVDRIEQEQQARLNPLRARLLLR